MGSDSNMPCKHDASLGRGEQGVTNIYPRQNAAVGAETAV